MAREKEEEMITGVNGEVQQEQGDQEDEQAQSSVASSSEGPANDELSEAAEAEDDHRVEDEICTRSSNADEELKEEVNDDNFPANIAIVSGQEEGDGDSCGNTSQEARRNTGDDDNRRLYRERRLQSQQSFDNWETNSHVDSSESSLDFIMGVVRDRVDEAKRSQTDSNNNTNSDADLLQEKAQASAHFTIVPMPPTPTPLGRSMSADASAKKERSYTPVDEVRRSASAPIQGHVRTGSATAAGVGAHSIVPFTHNSEDIHNQGRVFGELMAVDNKIEGDIEYGSMEDTSATTSPNPPVPEPSAPGAYAFAPLRSHCSSHNEEDQTTTHHTEPTDLEFSNNNSITTDLPPDMFRNVADPARSGFRGTGLDSGAYSSNSYVTLLEATLVEETNTNEADSRWGSSSVRSSKILVQATPMRGPKWCCTIDCHCDILSSHACRWTALLTLLLVILTVGLGFGLGFTDDSGNPDIDTNLPINSTAGTNGPIRIPTLERIQERGSLVCGIGSISPALHYVDSNGEPTGFDVTLCRALAAAVLGDPTLVEFKILHFKGRFLALANDEVDVIAAGATHTMEREVFESESKLGYSFSAPYVYEGLHFAGNPDYVACVEGGIRNTGDCSDLSVCTIEGTSHHAVLSRMLPGRQLVAVLDYKAMVRELTAGTCVVIAHEGHQLQKASVRELGYRGEYMIGSDVYSKEPLALVTRSDDTQWSKFVNMILQSLFLAEKHGITKDTAYASPQIDSFGTEYSDMFRNAIAVSGNYGEMYNDFLEPILPRSQNNMINDYTAHDATGLMFSHPIGSAEVFGDDPVGTLLEDIQDRGRVRCGLMMRRPGFAYLAEGGRQGYKGMELDLCKAISAALFAGFTDKVEIVPVEDRMEGYTALEERRADVFAGASWDYLSYTHGAPNYASKLAFTQPYFYTENITEAEEENLCLATNAKDHKWSAFVYWIVSGLIQAEENGIDVEDSNAMPEINLFGRQYSRMLRDVVLTFGNIGHLYEHSLEDLYPRRGRNLVNNVSNAGPQHYPIPGLDFGA